MKKLGLIINPVAGIGGSAGLKGSDGEDILRRALELGAKPLAQQRAGTAVEQLAPIIGELEIVTYGGGMGEELLLSMGIPCRVLGRPANPSTPEDTRSAARAMAAEGVELLLFAGGDGTARDICAAGVSCPVLGIPAGVKIHSAVYALNPRSAGLAALEYLREGGGAAEAEVMDIDEGQFRQGRVAARLYGYLTTPAKRERMQSVKSPNAAEEEELLDIADYIAGEMEPDTVYIIGPGSTTRYITERLGLEGTLLGVDAVLNGELALKDAGEAQLWALISPPEVKAKIIVTIIGGQGLLFGRGNQQLSPRILRRVGRANIIPAAAHAKLRQLGGRPLWVDTGDAALDEELSGYMDVVAGYGQTVFYKVEC